MVMEVVQEDMGEASMQCTNHPYKNSTPGGICAFCLQEKLGKLVSSSLPVTVFPSSSSSPPSPSFRSEFGGNSISTTNTTAASSLAIRPNAAASSTTSSHLVSYGRSSNNGGDCNNYNHHHDHQYHNRRSKLMFLSTHRKKKKKEAAEASSIVFKRSKSTTTPRRRGMNFLEEAADDSENYNSPHKKGFWSFLYLSSRNHTTKKLSERGQKEISYPMGVASMNGGSSMRSREKKLDELVVVEENESPDEAATTINRKVSRSRSVGCGSRSFSGDFFERISTGLGDCTLRRVESQREGKHKVHHRNSGVGNGQDCIKERVKCGGIFSGFMITSSSSSSSSSSYLVSSSNEDNNNNNVNGRTATTTPSSSTISGIRHLAHGRSKSWGWAFASPMRAFTKPSSNGKASSNKNATPNLAAIPSLLSVRS